MSCVAGYTILNDVTDREAQRDGKQWFRGKSRDTFCPLGPWLVTAGRSSPTRTRCGCYSKIRGQITAGRAAPRT